MKKYILDNNIFDYFVLLDTKHLEFLSKSGNYFVVSNVKNYQLKKYIEKYPDKEEKIKEIFRILTIKTLPNKHFIFMEDKPFWELLYPFKDNTSPTFLAVKWSRTNLKDTHDALIADAAFTENGVLVTEDKKLISASIKEGIFVLSYKDFLLEVGLKF
jgi:hypothetical protein